MWGVAAAALAGAPAGFDPFEADDAHGAARAVPTTDRTGGYDPFEAADLASKPGDRQQKFEAPAVDPFDVVGEQAAQEVERSTPVEETPVTEAPVEAPGSELQVTEEKVAEELAVEEPAIEEASEDVSTELVDESSLPVSEKDEARGLRAELVISDSEHASDSFVQADSKETETPWWQLQVEAQPPQAQAAATPEQIAQRRQQIEKERAKAKEACEQIYREVRDDVISTVNLDIRLKGNPGEDYPFDCTLGSETFQPRNWASITYRWKASGLCSKPLYFQEVQLERYGHTWGPVLQPFVSGAHFFLTVPALPYAMGIQTPNECVYALGYYRPGSCAPYMIEALPFTWRAAAFQGGVATGMAFIFP